VFEKLDSFSIPR